MPPFCPTRCVDKKQIHVYFSRSLFSNVDRIVSNGARHPVYSPVIARSPIERRFEAFIKRSLVHFPSVRDLGRVQDEQYVNHLSEIESKAVLRLVNAVLMSRSSFRVRENNGRNIT